VISTRVRRYLFTHYTPETLLNLVFEDLRKPKAPNTPPPPLLLPLFPLPLPFMLRSFLHLASRSVTRLRCNP
jgi:hypothetical protein